MKAILVNDEEEKLERQDEELWNSSKGNGNNAYSLNYCIDDDLEEENHYENHLKFKKQVLERDLFDGLYKGKDRKKHHDEDFIFKNLYNPRPSTAAVTSSQNALRPRVKKPYILSDNSK